MAFEVTRMVLTSNGLIDIEDGKEYARVYGNIGYCQFHETDLHAFVSPEDITDMLLRHAHIDEFVELYEEETGREIDPAKEFSTLYSWLNEDVATQINSSRGLGRAVEFIGNLKIRVVNIDKEFKG